jgi:two-component system, response regulator YesN
MMPLSPVKNLENPTKGPLKKTIFLVDDDPAVLQSLKMFLEDRYNLAVAKSGEEALRIFKERKDFDLIILDYRLGDIDGLTVFKKIRKEDRVIPILFMSAYGTKELLAQMLEVRANAFIDKPWDIDQLEQKISRLLEFDPFERVHRNLNICIDNLSIKIRRAMQYIDRHYGSAHLSLEEVGRAVSLHPKYLSASFKQECGVGFHDYLIEIRIDRALQILKDPHRTIKEVSNEVGFSDQGYFSKVFQGKMGLSPSAYRR